VTWRSWRSAADDGYWLTFLRGKRCGAVQRDPTASVLLTCVRVCCVRVPQVVKVRLQVQTSQAASTAAGMMYRGPVDCAVAILRSEGVLGLYRGWLPLVARDVPFNALFFGMYNAYSKLLSAYAGTDLMTPPAWQALLAVRSSTVVPSLVAASLVCPHPLSKLYARSLLCAVQGGLAGSTAWSIVFPCDVVKSRLQAGVGARSNGLRVVGRIVLDLYRAGGARVFYNGVAAAVLRAFPANGALFMGYEMTRKLLP
jgi:hypothetical protein